MAHPAGLPDLVSDPFSLSVVSLSFPLPLCVSLLISQFVFLRAFGSQFESVPFLCLSVSFSLSVCVSVSVSLCFSSFCKLPSPPAQNTPMTSISLQREARAPQCDPHLHPSCQTSPPTTFFPQPQSAPPTLLLYEPTRTSPPLGLCTNSSVPLRAGPITSSPCHLVRVG